MSVKSMLCRPGVYFTICVVVGVYLVTSGWTTDNEVDELEFLPADARTLAAVTSTSKQSMQETEQAQEHPERGVQCMEKRNFVFIKCMKCATETMATVLRRFGYTRNLSFVLPVKTRIYLGWPYLMSKFDYRPSSRGYNILMEHSIYNKTIMEDLMPKDTVYISIIREPFSHVKSSLNYWKVFQIANVTGEDPLSEYFHNLEKYEAIYKSPEQHTPRYCIPDDFSMTKNLLSHCLGMPLGFPSGREDISLDQDATQRYIENLDRDFYLIMLVEYFHESLVLLKRKMCWTFQDILYMPVNRKDYTYKDESSHLELVHIYKNWSPIDYQLYDHFNKTFWKQVGEQRSDFFEEVAEYSRVQATVAQFCDYGGIPNLSIQNSTWSPGFSMVKEDCKMFWPNLLKLIKSRYDEEETNLLENAHPPNQTEFRARC